MATPMNLNEYWDAYEKMAPKTESNDDDDCHAALERADRLITWMATSIGGMSPGGYRNAYSELNEHWIYMEKLKAKKKSHK